MLQEAAYLYNALPLQAAGFLVAEVHTTGKRVRSRPGRPGLLRYAKHLSGEEAVGGIPGTAGGEAGWVRWIALDLDRAEWEDLAPVLEEWWEKGLYAYPSRGLTRGWRLWLWLSRPVSQGRAFRLAMGLKRLLEERGLGPVEAFPSSPDPGRGQRTLLPYFGGRNPLLHPKSLEPIPLAALPRARRVDPGRVGVRRKRLEAMAEEVRRAPKGTRHHVLLQASLKGFALGLSPRTVEEVLRKAALEAGLPEGDDPEEVERILSWARAKAKKPTSRGKPHLPPPDLKRPIFRGRRGLSLYLLLGGFWRLYQLHGYEEDGKPRVQASFRQLAEAAGLSLDTTRRHLKRLRESGVLEGTWTGEPDQGTVWTVHLEAWPGGEKAALLPSPAWSWGALGPAAGAVYGERRKGKRKVKEIAEATGLHRETVRRALKRLEKVLGPEAGWEEALEAYEKEAVKGWERRRDEHALQRAAWLEALAFRREALWEKEVEGRAPPKAV